MKYRKKPIVIEAVQFVDTEESILKLSELGLDPVRIALSKEFKVNFIHANQIFLKKHTKNWSI